MARGSTVLGKRSRSSALIDDVDIPSSPPLKRSRRIAALLASRDENRDLENDDSEPSNSDDDDDDDDFEPLAKTPTKTPARTPARTTAKPPTKPPKSPTTVPNTPSAQRTRQIPSLAAALKSPYPITPSTPRHRDVFASPSTPRHVVMSAGKLFSRHTPSSTPGTAAVQTIYHAGRQLFARGADPGELVGRQREKEQLDAFLARVGTSTPGGCLYVSGPPGTGKSAMVQKRTEAVVAEHEGVRRVHVNCMSVKSCKALYDTIAQAVGSSSSGEENEKTSRWSLDVAEDAAAALQALFVSKKSSSSKQQSYLVVLDEIDHILTMDLESLYRLFEWSLHRHSRLALVGIANALDLTDRHLPRLKSKNLKPELLPVLPYTTTQIKTIITTRLRTLLPVSTTATPDFVPLIHPAAIELCARKVSSQTGDLRRVFEVCRRALDMIEAETRSKLEAEARESILLMTPSRKPLGENANPPSASSAGKTSTAAMVTTTTTTTTTASTARSVPQMLMASLGKLTAENAPRASIGHLNKVTAAAFSNGTSQRLKALNLQQKAALCALIAKQNHSRDIAGTASGNTTPAGTPSKTGRGGTLFGTPSKTGRGNTSAPTIRTLYESYAALCTSDGLLHPLSASEFREVVGSLETLGLVQEVDGRTGSLVSRGGSGGVSGSCCTPGGRKKTVMMSMAGFPAGDQRRMASCVGQKEMEDVICGGVGEGILRGILDGEALE